MDPFSVTKLNRAIGEVLGAAHRRPVALTDRGKRKYILMASDHYDRIVKTDPRRTYYLPEALDDMKAEILAALDAEDGRQS